jgi:hypothetical protein
MVTCAASCTCQRHDGRNAKHGHAKGYRITATYRAWGRMRRRGYSVHPAWRNSFPTFFADMCP